MKKLQSFFLLIAFTLLSVSCENSNQKFELERDSNISEMISFKMTLRNNFSSLNRTLRQENWKLGNLDDMQHLYKSQNINFQNGFNLGLNLFVESQENARTFTDSFSVNEEQMSFIEEVIDGAINFQDPSNYISFLENKFLEVENLQIDIEKKNYLFLFVASQIEIVKFLNDYVNYESQSSGRLMGCELTSSDALAVGIGIWGGAISGGLFGTIVGGGILSVPAGIAGFIGGALTGAIVGGATLAVQKAIECSK